MAQRLSSLEELQAVLEGRGATCTLREGVLCMALRIGGAHEMMQIRWVPDPGYVQVAVSLPVTVPRSHLAAVALVIARINAGSVLLGFVLDLDSGVVLYRATAITEPDGSLSMHVADACMTTAMRSANKHAAALAAAAR